MNGDPVVRLEGIERTFASTPPVHALKGIDLRIEGGEYVSIVGASGSGKSTLMHVIGCLDRPTAGRYQLEGVDVAELSDARRTGLRGRRIGFVFQSFHLLPRLTALDNVILPLTYRPGSTRDRRRRAVAALEAVGLCDRMDHRPTELSGGQQQRVAIARALVTEPALLLADEPTGNLDSRTGEDIMALLERLQSERGTALVVITHERDIAGRAANTIELRDGRVVDQDAEGSP